MASIDSQTLFITTSPRTPAKMIPEIGLLASHFTGEKWNKITQAAFMEILRDENFFNGKGENDPAFSARDRINRAPKALGFIDISNEIHLTPAGKMLLNTKRSDEVFLRQMLKFQIPSPYHKPSAKAANFCVKPYLEFLRFIRTLGTLRFDELQIFVMQLTDWHDFDVIIEKIEKYRQDIATTTLTYKQLKAQYLKDELTQIYATRIANGDTRTRETKDASLQKFIATQTNNLRDYADAAVRSLRATGLVNVSHKGHTLSIVPERTDDVDYLLRTVNRDPGKFQSEEEYIVYLGAADMPKLFTDDRDVLVEKLQKEFPEIELSPLQDIEQLKDLFADALENRKISAIQEQVRQIKDYRLYDDIQNTFQLIEDKELYDTSLMLEWNTWRAMTMIDGGDIKANLSFDDYGKPRSTAQGNMSDIVCDYGEFSVSVEVTMASGQKQYEMESEPVSRHLGKLKKLTSKPAYCLFIAPTINEACIAHFYMLHKIDVKYYGGKSVIIPLSLSVFRRMIEESYRVSYTPNPKQVQKFLEYSTTLANNCSNENEWYNAITEAALHWLNL